MTWRGPQCFCPLGQKPAGTSCVDTNECENNVCDQICQVTNSIFFTYIWCVSFTQLLIHTLNSLVQDTVGSFTCSCVPGYVYLLHHHYTECAFHWLSSSSGIAWKSRPHAQQSTFHQRCQWEFFHFIAFNITTIIIIGEEVMPKSKNTFLGGVPLILHFSGFS